VNAYGNVMPCVGIDLPVGNIRKNKLADILRDSEVIQDLRRYQTTIKGPCATCEKSESCYGCRGAAYQLTGDYLGSDPLCWKSLDRQNEIDRLPMAVDNLIPQRAPMKMVNTLLFVGERTAEVETLITRENPFLDDQQNLEPAACMEIIAQAAAAHNGFRTRHLAAQPEGFLLGAKQLKITGTARCGDRLRTTVYKEAKLGEFGVIRGSVYNGDQCIAEGEIKVFHKGQGAE
jgi:radical SAM protein with 4Fe4S-binding SPASM domain